METGKSNDAGGDRADHLTGASVEKWTAKALDGVQPACWIGRDVPPIHLDGEEFFLVSWKGEMFLVPNRCPHRGGPLKYGFVNATDEIVCPMHHNAFSIERLVASKNARRLKVERR